MRSMKKQKEINKIRKKIQDIEGEFNKDMESLKKKKRPGGNPANKKLSKLNKNTLESHSSLLKQVTSEKVLGLEDKVEITEKTDD
jgi:hypothetical protein